MVHMQVFHMREHILKLLVHCDAETICITNSDWLKGTERISWFHCKQIQQ